ncbi:restriction endonuclease subunit S [Salipiger pallidus]|uniref:Restriction endonuclease subunit S n=1 Tax=Salipiger pallidus TaxID=1775170 RepID=A0A8J3EFH6_9RHOB|nr:restriction endonuclease subunit S [Salipiger pallidus]GGG65509.1 restriction endonuclease subunit S [Salipiger pallidus]
MVPEGWEKTRLDEHITIKHGFAFSSEYFDPNGEDIVLTPGNFYEEGGFRPLGEKQKRYDGPIPKDYILSPGDMLVAMTEQTPGLLGSTLFVPSVDRYLHNQRLGLIQKLEGSNINLNFLHLLLGMPSIRRRISADSGGTKVKHTSPSKITGLDVLLPPLPEQKKIAEILSTWDRAIETAEALLATARTQKRALMQTLLTGKRRFPEFEGQEWREVSIGDVAREVSIRNKENAALPVISCSKVVGFVNSLDYFKKQVFSDDLSGYKVISRGQIGYPSNHIEEGSIGIQNLYESALVSPIYTIFEPKPEIDAMFLFRVLKTDLYRQKFAAATNASVDRRGSLRWKAFAQIKVPLPSLGEQRRINAAHDAVDDEIQLRSEQAKKLRTEKKALMQQLLTGKRRVRVETADAV